jgi:hypothetical protein
MPFEVVSILSWSLIIKSAPSSTPYFIKKVLQKSVSLLITVVTFSNVWVPYFSSSVLFGHLKTWASTQILVEAWTLESPPPFFFFFRTHMAPNSLAFQTSLFVVLCVMSFSWLIDGACLSCLWSEVEAHPLVCIRSLAIVIPNSLCDNFGPQEGRMIKLLRMAVSRRWRNSFFGHFQVYLLME